MSFSGTFWFDCKPPWTTDQLEKEKEEEEKEKDEEEREKGERFNQVLDCFRVVQSW